MTDLFGHPDDEPTNRVTPPVEYIRESWILLASISDRDKAKRLADQWERDSVTVGAKMAYENLRKEM